MTLATPTSDLTVTSRPRGARRRGARPAEDVQPQGQEGGPLRAQASVAGARRRHVHDRPWRVRRHPRPERLGEVDARPSPLDAAHQRRRRGADLRPRRVRGDVGDPPARQPRLGRGVVLQEDVRGGEPLVRGALLRDDAEPDACRPFPRSSRRSASRPSGATSRWRTSRAACSRRSPSRGRS